MPLVTKVSGSPNQCREDQAGEASYSEVGQRGRPRDQCARAGWRVRPGSVVATSGCRLANGSHEWKAPWVRLTIVAFARGGSMRPFKARHGSKGPRFCVEVAGPAKRFSKGGSKELRERLAIRPVVPHVPIQSVRDVGERQEVSGLDQLGVNPRPHGCGRGAWQGRSQGGGATPEP